MTSLPDDPDLLKTMLLAERARAERLEQIIKAMQRHRFGRKAESLPEDQLLLGLEEAEQAEAAAEVQHEQADPAERKRRAAQRRRNRGALPAHLPRLETIIDIEDLACPCCRNALHRIGEDISERLDIVPAQLRVLVVRRPKYACRACEVVVQAPAPARVIEGGLPTDALVAQVLVSKYADHLPLYRQAQIYARQGISLDRSTLADWVGRAAWHLRPVHERLLAQLKTSPGHLPMRPPRRCSIPAAARPRRVSCLPMRGMIVRGAARIRPEWLTSMRPIARRPGRLRICPVLPACCRWTATAAIGC
jgi:transposase